MTDVRDVRGTSVNIPTQDGSADAYLAHPDDNTAHPAVLFYMDAIGLRPRLKEMADRLAGAGYTVLVPNLLYRHGRPRWWSCPTSSTRPPDLRCSSNSFRSSRS